MVGDENINDRGVRWVVGEGVLVLWGWKEMFCKMIVFLLSEELVN